MKKAELIQSIMKTTGLPKAKVHDIYDAIIENLTLSLKQGESFNIKGFGTFDVKKRKARTGRNPMTGQSININAAAVPFFKASGKLKTTINSPDLIRMEDNVSKENHAVMDIFYATDRAFIKNQSPSKSYDANRSTEINYGVTKVSIPRDHRMGEIESPSILKLEFSENPDKHIMLKTLVRLKDNDFYDQLRKGINKSNRKAALIFFHGYNVSFKEAAQRTAQMAYDLTFDGAATFYSWPSHNKTLKYTLDETNIRWSEPNIEQFLTDYAEKSDAEDIFIIAHSMGNRGFTRSYITMLQKKPHLKDKFKAIILAAPDIDAEIFKKTIAPAMTKVQDSITLYASSHDIALQTSKKIHGYNRAGDSGKDIVLIDGIESIDCSHVETGFLGHSYYADERSMLSDMFYLINHNLTANQRTGLKKVVTDEGIYWRIKK